MHDYLHPSHDWKPDPERNLLRCTRADCRAHQDEARAEAACTAVLDTAGKTSTQRALEAFEARAAARQAKPAAADLGHIVQEAQDELRDSLSCALERHIGETFTPARAAQMFQETLEVLRAYRGEGPVGPIPDPKLTLGKATELESFPPTFIDWWKGYYGPAPTDGTADIEEYEQLREAAYKGWLAARQSWPPEDASGPAQAPLDPSTPPPVPQFMKDAIEGYVPNPGGFLEMTGLLFHLNRQIFHPLGLALTVVHFADSPPEATQCVVLIGDHRKDPDGCLYGPEAFQNAGVLFETFIQAQAPRLQRRLTNLGYVLQPAPGPAKETPVVTKPTLVKSSTEEPS